MSNSVNVSESGSIQVLPSGANMVDSQFDSHGLGHAWMKPNELYRRLYEIIRDGGGRTPIRRT